MNEKIKARRRKLLDLLNKIVNGELNNSDYPIDEMYSLYKSMRDQYQSGPRKEYISPNERSTYNYGYMTADQLEAGTPNVW